MSTSVDLGMKLGKYDSFEGSHARRYSSARPLGGRCRPGLFGTDDGAALRERGSTAKWGSKLLLMLLMPTASYLPRGSGRLWSVLGACLLGRRYWRFIVVNKKLVKMLEERDSGHGDQAKPLSSTGIIRAVVISQSLFGAF
jgi:hypothetical protein